MQIRIAPDNCEKCALCENRIQVVQPYYFMEKEAIKEEITKGDNRPILVVGEAPGKMEDVTGEPFVGRSGQLLREKLRELSEEIIITNVVKCRPDENRDPKREEIEACFTYLEKEIIEIDPKLIIAVGRFAATTLLKKCFKHNKVESIMKISSEEFPSETAEWNFSIIPIFHPAVLLYRSGNRDIWDRHWEIIGDCVRETKKRPYVKKIPKDRLDGHISH